MANYNSKEVEALLAVGVNAESKGFGGKVRLYKNEFALESQATGSTLTCQTLPENGYVVGIILHGTSLGTAKIKIGDATDDDAYVVEATNTATTFATPVVADYLACGGKTPVITTSTAGLPASGAFFVDFLVAENR